MPRLLLRFVATIAALLALTLPRAATAQQEASALPPRDVVVVVQPSAERLPPLPSDFQRIDDGWLVLEFPSSVRARVESLARDAQEFRGRLQEHFAQPVLDHVLVRVARTPEQMTGLAPADAPPPEYAAGVAYGSLHLALLALQAPGSWEAPDLEETMRHELTHLALEDAASGHHVPRWFSEGIAIEESGELPWARLKVLWNATTSHQLIPLADLDRRFPASGYEVNVAYAESADFVRFLMRDSDRARFGSLVQRVRDGNAFDRALEDAYGTDTRKLEYEWREEVSHRFGIVPILTGGGALWVLIAGLAAAAWVKRRRRAKARLAQWAQEEVAAEADRAAAIARAKEIPGASEDQALPGVVRGVPVVEHDGGWHTLH